MTIQEVYEKYKKYDEEIETDAALRCPIPTWILARGLWQAIKKEVEKQKQKDESCPYNISCQAHLCPEIDEQVGCFVEKP